MEQERLIVHEDESCFTKLGRLIVSTRFTAPSWVSLVIGRPGLSNVEKRLSLGDAVLYETPDEGLFELRAWRLTSKEAEILITRVAPTPGIAGGLVSGDPSNAAFTPSELAQIASSVRQIQDRVATLPNAAPEQLDFIRTKLDEMQAAADRMGRKDWLNLAVGTLTGIVATAALPPDAGRALFRIAGEALSWLIGSGGLKLLP